MPVATVYENPWERVSFSRARDANPFFHFFEALWILAGRDDVRFLTTFNPRMAEFSDDGKTFHAPYGERMRIHFGQDQIKAVIRMLIEDPDTRRAVMSIWDPMVDLGTVSKDIPCNSLIMFKVRDGALHMTVCCRSNDVIWGAYGANVVQFSTLHQLICEAVNVKPGTYTQVSDSFHIYWNNDAWQRMLKAHDWRACKYMTQEVTVAPMLCGMTIDNFLTEVEDTCFAINEGTIPNIRRSRYLSNVAMPMWSAWKMYRVDGHIGNAIDYLETQDLNNDWLQAGMKWLIRRIAR